MKRAHPPISSEFRECDLCNVEYDMSDHVPMTLVCGCGNDRAEDSMGFFQSASHSSIEPHPSQSDDVNDKLITLSSLPATPIQISINTSEGKIFSLDVQSDETIDNVKLKIQTIEGCSSASSNLAFNGKLLSGLGAQTLRHYNIQNNDRLNYWTSVVRPRFFCKTLNGTRIPFLWEPSDTIGFLKQKIEEKEGTPSGQQWLVFAGALTH